MRQDTRSSSLEMNHFSPEEMLRWVHSGLMLLFVMRHINTKTVPLKKSSIQTLQFVFALPVGGFVSSFMDYSGMSRVILLLQKSPCFTLTRDVGITDV